MKLLLTGQQKPIHGFTNDMLYEKAICVGHTKKKITENLAMHRRAGEYGTHVANWINHKDHTTSVPY